uniref:F-box domain-containing protein n=1 Tax=Mesocestoides corti TaxID=53468 RepID=A0A5K3F7Y9_MESCO
MDPAKVFPQEIILRILQFVPPSPDYASLACVSKQWRDLVTLAMRSRLHAAIVSLHRINELRWHPLILNIDLSKRLGVSLAVNGHTLYIFGGCTPELTAMNDLITLDLLTLKWMRVATQGNRPSPRALAITGFIGNKLYLYGGCRYVFQGFDSYISSVNISLTHRLVSVNDLYSFCPKSNTWTLVLQHEKGPPLSKYCNGVFLPPVDTESDTYPPLLVLSDGSNERVYPYALLPETGRWFPIPPCPHRAPPAGGPAGHRGPSPYRPAMCALGQKQVLVVCRGVTQPSVWILSRSDRRPNQGLCEPRCGSSCVVKQNEFLHFSSLLQSLSSINYAGSPVQH